MRQAPGAWQWGRVATAVIPQPGHRTAPCIPTLECHRHSTVVPKWLSLTFMHCPCYFKCLLALLSPLLFHISPCSPPFYHAPNPADPTFPITLHLPGCTWGFWRYDFPCLPRHALAILETWLGKWGNPNFSHLPRCTVEILGACWKLGRLFQHFRGWILHGNSFIFCM